MIFKRGESVLLTGYEQSGRYGNKDIKRYLFEDAVELTVSSYDHFDKTYLCRFYYKGKGRLAYFCESEISNGTSDDLMLGGLL